MEIQEFDKNFRNLFPDEQTGIVWHDVRCPPFALYGLYCPETEPTLHRMPREAAARVSDGVAALERHTSGGRLRFSTNSPYIALRMRAPSFTRFSHMPLGGTAGFDLYIDDDGIYSFVNTFRPDPKTLSEGYTSAIDMSALNYGEGWHSFTVNLPLYNAVDEFQIGIRPGYEVGPGRTYRDLPPIVYYGSSITQGGCASRPGNAYPNIISRRLDMDFLNLGFSGQAKGQRELAEYIATLDMSLFVLDYDHNAPSPAHLEASHYAFYEVIRSQQPTLPILMVSRPDVPQRNAQVPLRRAIVRSSYERAIAAGDRYVRHIDGADLFAGEEWWDCTVDGTHPNDLGFRRMADVIGAQVAAILKIDPAKRR